MQTESLKAAGSPAGTAKSEYDALNSQRYITSYQDGYLRRLNEPAMESLVEPVPTTIKKYIRNKMIKLYVQCNQLLNCLSKSFMQKTVSVF